MAQGAANALVVLVLLGPPTGGGAKQPAAATVLNPPPGASDWAALAKLPDWSGVWTPFISDQNRRIEADPVPWRPEVAEQIKALEAEEEAGRRAGRPTDPRLRRR